MKSEGELLRELPNVDAAVVWSFSAPWYELSPRLKHVFTPAAGREQVSPDPSSRVKTHHGAFHGQIMAESLLAMLLFMNRRLGPAMIAQQQGRWERGLGDSSVALRGQTALLIGYGAIGRQCAELLQAVGMVVHGLKREVEHGQAGVQRLFGPRQLHEALSLADHVACILPGDTGTTHLIDETALSALKTSAFLYNLGRGNAIDLDALVRALEQRRLAGAFLDVLPEEPPSPRSPAFHTPNLFFTPHASAIRKDYLDLYFSELATELQKLSTGQILS
ncbi:MAG TPA: NAD(P)-dependent oxidoreductase [Polyangiaceae bacterium]|nr:NAD(P)-dependent oxidoreductase [Polyangiaceae bacterium]